MSGEGEEGRYQVRRQELIRERKGVSVDAGLQCRNRKRKKLRNGFKIKNK
jgi:hypothetical protein